MKASTLKTIGELAIVADLALRERYKAKVARNDLFREYTNETGEFYDGSVFGGDPEPGIEAARAVYTAANQKLIQARTRLRSAIRKES